MSKETYTPLVNKPKNDFKLVPTSRGTEKAIRKIEVRWAGSPIQQRKGICDIEQWEYEKHIPEVSWEPKLSLKALRGLLKRCEKNNQDVAEQLEQLIENQGNEHEEVPAVSSDEYWMGLAKALLKGFQEFADRNEVSPDDLNFKEIQRAYSDFFEPVGQMSSGPSES